MRRVLMTLTAAALALPFVARADTRFDDTTYGTTTSTTTRYDEPRYNEVTPHGGPSPSVGIMADVGVDKYNRDISHEVDAGVGYGARVDLSPQRNVGLELAYHGAVNNLSDNLSTDGRLITNAFGGNLRFNLVPATRDLPARMKPFVFGGANYHRIDTDNFTPGISDNINAFGIPVGAGLEADIGDRFLVGGRFTYNFLFNEVDKLGGRNADMWAATVNLGTRLGY